VAAPSGKNTRLIRALGRNLRDWRVIHGITAQLMAERAGISRTTLHAIESGSPAVRLENVMAVMRLLSLADAVVAATDPQNSELGRLRTTRPLPQRVRK